MSIPGFSCRGYGVFRVIRELLACEVTVRDCREIKREGRLGIDVQFADDAGAISSGLKTAREVRRVFAIQAKSPGRQANLPVLMWIQAREKTRPGLTTSRLRHERAIEAHALRRELVKVGRLRIRIAVTVEFRVIVLGDIRKMFGRDSAADDEGRVASKAMTSRRKNCLMILRGVVNE